jgi:hypothetical protein
MTWNLSNLVHAHSRHHGASVDSIMRLSGSKGNWFVFGLPSLEFDVWEVLVSCGKKRHLESHASSWASYSIDFISWHTKFGTKELDELLLHDGEDWRHVINMRSGVKNTSDVLSHVSDWVGSMVKLVVEIRMHCVHAVMESGFDGLNALLDALTLFWNWTNGINDLLWHGEVANLGSLWLTGSFVVFPDNRRHLHDHLVEILDHLFVFWTNLFFLVVGRERLHS